jgi:hypothetical protein
MPFVAGFLTSSDVLIAEGAAFVLGESRELQAFNILCDHWENSINHEFKVMLLFPIALTRCDEAFEFLLDVIRYEHHDKAAAAVKALKIYDDDHDRRESIYQAVVTCNDARVFEVYADEFEQSSD